MMERRQIVQQWRRGQASVLVTLVRIEGSSYRRTGARLLIGEGGEHAGTISGGCLEADVLRRAAWKVRAGSVVEHYSMRFDDTAEVPFGLGCGGSVDLLLEPCDTPECQALLAALEESLRGRELRVATWLPGDGGDLRRAVFAADGEVIFASDTLSASDLQQALHRKIEAGGAGEGGLYVEELAVPQRLIIYGAGEDARPLAGMAALLGWSVVVADGRAQFATRERFPQAEEVVVLGVAALGEHRQIETGPRDAVVIMTHSYEQDRRLLAATLQRPTLYLGVLGARHRTSVLVSEAAAILGLSLEECCARLHAPVGLDLGGDGPEAIALSILAQVQAVAEGHGGEQRVLTPKDVAEHLERGGVSQMLRAECAL